jgi:rhodanese-related sulfurtransferase
LARILLDRGYTRVRALQGGFQAWERAGLPMQPAG